MLNPHNSSDVAGAGIAVALVVAIFGLVALVVTTVLTQPIWLVLISPAMLLGAIAVRLYYSGSAT
jgi:hypothetical protein